MSKPGGKKWIVGIAGRFAFTALSFVAKRLNPKRMERWGMALGDFIRLSSSRYRRVVKKNLTRAFPDWSEAEVERVGRKVFGHFARGILEFFHLLNLSREDVDRWVDITGTEHLDRALEAGHGAVLITAHYGNWELFARKLVLRGYPLNVIARDSDDAGMTGIANKIRESAGYHVLSRENAALPAIRRLKKNELLGILPDQNSFTGIMVDFFGHPAMTATGPAVFSLKAGSPVICGFGHREPDGRFKVTIHPPLEVEITGDDETDTRTITAAFTKAIEQEIRKDPSQWLWLHDRWRRADDIVSGRLPNTEKTG